MTERNQALLRPPAAPLVACDPYFSVWSVTDRLPDDWTRHWTGAIHAMVGLIRVDGATYRFMGRSPSEASLARQVSLRVLPTRTLYEFEAGPVNLSLTFTTPLIANDLELLGRPVTYVTFQARSRDERSHEVTVYFDCTAEWVVDRPHQKVAWSRVRIDGQDSLRMGAAEQNPLNRSGDDLRIDWGHLYLAPVGAEAESVIGGHAMVRGGFITEGTLPGSDDLRMPRSADDDYPVMALALPFGKVSAESVARTLLLAYDDEFSIEYFHRRLRPYWRRGGWDAGRLLRESIRSFDSIAKRCEEFDTRLIAELTRVGGEKYAAVAALAYRQSLAASKLVADVDGAPLHFSKENFSNGCIATVDVIYPACPLALYFDTTLLKAQLTPVLDYTTMARWKRPFAPHDLGTYPLANGQVYGDGERGERNQMPVEESGNMLIMLAAMAQRDGNADYAGKYWTTLERWAEYLRDKGLDPENQLCTDDFAGHMAHNTNLSLKAIIALGAFAKLCQMRGLTDRSQEYAAVARRFAADWVNMADDGDHFRLAFDRPGTWSQKYNLVWDRLLGLGLFDAEVARREVAFYKTRLKPYGFPLDSRSDYTKLDWEVWCASLADNRADFETLFNPIFEFANSTPDRVPLTDWYWTVDGKKSGFQARSVVGGVFIKMLADRAAWNKRPVER